MKKLFYSLASCLSALSLNAATFTVSNLVDHAATTGSLRWAVAQANANPNPNPGGDPIDVIEFDPAVFGSVQTITLSGSELYLSGPTEIRGPGQSLLTISANNAFRVLAVSSGAVVTLRDLTIADGRGGQAGPSTPATGNLGAGIMNLGSLTLQQVTVTRCVNELNVSLGGGVYNSGSLAVDNSTISGNWSIGIGQVGSSSVVTRGGGIYNDTGGEVVCRNSALTDNHAEPNITTGGASGGSHLNNARGGGMFNLGTARFENCQIHDNVVRAEALYFGGSSRAFGGGVYNAGTLEIVNGCELHRNRVTAIPRSGGTSIAAPAEAFGGAIYNLGTVEVWDADFLGNVAETSDSSTPAVGGLALGGAVYGSSAQTTVRRSSLCSNTAQASPGGRGTSAVAAGGGALYAEGGTLIILECAIVENRAVANPSYFLAGGGGVQVDGGTVEITNSTLVSNSCSVDGDRNGSRGGGVSILRSGNGGLYHNSIASNSAFITNAGPGSLAAGGGVFVDSSSSVNLANNAVCGNRVTTGYSGLDLGGTVSSLGHNICGDPNGVAGLIGSDILNVTATSVFDDRDMSGGIDLDDLYPSGNSQVLLLEAAGPAVDAGNNALLPNDFETGVAIATDQRSAGFARIVNGTTDIGAVEQQAGLVFLDGKVTYVDAAPSNTTLSDGTPYQPRPDGTNGTDDLWEERPGGNASTVYDSNSEGPEDAPRLRTRVCQLTFGEEYEVFAYFWAGSNDWWKGRASLVNTSGDLPLYSTNVTGGGDPAAPMTALTKLVTPNNGLNPGPISTSSGGFENGGYFANSVLTETGNLVLYQVSLGVAVANRAGCLEVFIDDFAGGSSEHRVWYDGLGFRVKREPYVVWSEASGLTEGVNDGDLQDPNGDGTVNLAHFAFDTDPWGAGTDEGKRRLSVESIDGGNYLTITRPFRVGAVFSSVAGAQVSSPVDGIVYRVECDGDLVAPYDLAVVEAGTVLDSGLPDLRDVDGDGHADWEYRTFRLVDEFETHQQAFLRMGVERVPD